MYDAHPVPFRALRRVRALYILLILGLGAFVVLAFLCDDSL